MPYHAIYTSLEQGFDTVAQTSPLVHCITNYVTVESCANALLAAGASPIMSDEPEDVRDLTPLCNALVINIGTLNRFTIEGMKAAAHKAAEKGMPIILDPVGAGASHMRTALSSELVSQFPVSIIRCNMSELKALAGASNATKGVDVSLADIVDSPEKIQSNAAFVAQCARRYSCVVAVSGPIDIISDGATAWAMSNGSPLQGKITGAGCMLTALCGAFAGASPDMPLESALCACALMGVAGTRAQERMTGEDATGSFHTYLMDALSLSFEELKRTLTLEEISL